MQGYRDFQELPHLGIRFVRIDTNGLAYSRRCNGSDYYLGIINIIFIIKEEVVIIIIKRILNDTGSRLMLLGA